jgi:hypothetical protein
MARSHSRHERPRGRAALREAYAYLQLDFEQLRRQRYEDHLEVVRLSALVDGLLAQMTTMSAQLAGLRQELQAMRSAPPARDPYVEVLAAQVAELRATVAAQQTVLADLTAALGAAVARAQHAEVEAAAAQSPALDTTTSPSPPDEPEQPRRDPAGTAPVGTAPAARPEPAQPAEVAAPGAPRGSGPGTARPTTSTEVSPATRRILVDLVERGASPAAAGAVVAASSTPGADDDAARRLRLIRETLSR